MSELLEKYQYWIRIHLAVEIFIKRGLLRFLHNEGKDPSYNGLTSDPPKLFHEMNLLKTKKSLQKVVKKDQWDKLCPKNKLSSSENWDITLICIVILNTPSLPKPKGGWKKTLPEESDMSRGAAVLRSRQLRNEINHGSLKDLSTEEQFLDKWQTISDILHILLDGEDFKRFQAFKTEDLTGFSVKAFKMINNRINEEKQTSENRKHLQERLKELNEIRELVNEWKSHSFVQVNSYKNQLTDGSSLLNTNLTDIQAAYYTVRCSVAMENFTKWPIMLQRCQVKHGFFNAPPRDIHPGMREGFAFHKSYLATFGCWIACSYVINDKYFHLSIYQPYTINNKYQNKLAMVINETHDVSAEQVLESHDKDNESQDKTTIRIQEGDICIVGEMGNAYKAQCSIKIYPKEFANLTDLLQKQQVDNDTYHDFIKLKFSTKIKRKSAKTKKQDLNDGLLLTGLKVGSSMQSTSLRSLHLRSVDVSCSGCIENFTKWQLFKVRCDVMRGYVSCPFQDVATGSKEIFASHARQHFGNGTYVRVTYSIENNGYFIHLLYFLPSSFAVYSNMMAIMTSHKKDETTEDILKSCTNNHFYGEIEPLCLKSEAEGVCVVGLMGSAQKTNIYFTIYPLQFKHLAKHIKERMEKKNKSRELYEGFIKSLSLNRYDTSSIAMQGCL
eukprot:TCONS_00015529-protein